MKIIKTKFKGLLILKQNNYMDKRGNLRVTYNKKQFKKNFIYEYCTVSKKNVLRGFHFQTKFIQSKFVNVVKGKILDVVIDLRKIQKHLEKFSKLFYHKKMLWDYSYLVGLRMHIIVMRRKMLFIISLIIIILQDLRVVFFIMIKK